MIELGVLAVLIAVLVGSIRLTRPSEKDDKTEDEDEDEGSQEAATGATPLRAAGDRG